MGVAGRIARLLLLSGIVCVLCVPPAGGRDGKAARKKAYPVYLQVKAERVRPRGGMPNVLAKLAAGKEVRIAYLGGSITAQNGWRPIQPMVRPPISDGW